ncbi:serine protease [Cupriavidus sp. WKF15]|uniref:serine protease n=1 Tax=Cupriavidus sp. WKF15 TaxID=3032282 RepID=UPI0023E2D74B|nr:serine protease [Cupriavidus sp. WKF15]WER44673.1 serine protease [Cupriavidus sp. WKF15]
MIEPVLLAVTRVATFEAQQAKTNATGFFFKRGQRLFVVTSRHVLIDEPTGHFPDRIEIELHVNPDNVAESIGFSIPLYRDGKSVWRDGLDGGGGIDVAVIELDRTALPSSMVYRAFTPAHLYWPRDLIEAGTPVPIVGFPLGFHDTLHHLPVVRQALQAGNLRKWYYSQPSTAVDVKCAVRQTSSLEEYRRQHGCTPEPFAATISRNHFRPAARPLRTQHACTRRAG